MKKVLKISGVFVFLIFIVFICYRCSPKADSPTDSVNKNRECTIPAIQLKMDMRKLWEDHIVWTRTVIFCLVDKLPGADEATKRLLNNQIAIGNIFKPYYGEESGDQLSALLHAHILISIEVITASNNGNLSALEIARKKWYDNSDEIAVFLNTLNPYWKSSKMKPMLHKHLKITSDDVVQRITNNYVTDIIAYDKIHDEILIMADKLAEGIVIQFPQKF